MAGPLSGVRVVDLTSVGMGPYATQIFGDMGADVIKIESAEGDVFRHVAPNRHPGMSAAFVQLNRNKRSVVLDLKAPDDLAVLTRLLDEADVFISNVRPQSLKRLGLSHEQLRARNPRLIYCGVVGFAEGGPYAGRPAFDDVIQAMSGTAALQGGVDGEPAYVNTIIADKTTGLTAAYSVAMALYERERSGEGQAIEVPMFETMVSFNMIEHLAGATFRDEPSAMGYGRVLSPWRRPYRTRDGHIGLLPYTTGQWKRFFQLAGCPEHAENPAFMEPQQRSRNIGQMYALLATLVAQRSTAEWLALLKDADIPMAPIQRPEDLLNDPHLQATGFFQEFDHPTEGRLLQPGIPVRYSRTPGDIRTQAPGLGEHTEAVRAAPGWPAR